MRTRHNIRTTYSYEDGEGNVLSEIELRIWFHYTPARPAYTPRGEYAPIDPPEPAEIDFDMAEEEAAPFNGRVWDKARPELQDWAGTWLENNESEAIEAASGDMEYHRERAAEYRADMRREEG